MGDPRRPRKKYAGPGHPWQKARLEEEGTLVKEFGLKNKKEVWKASSLQKSAADQAKRFIAADDAHAEVLKKQLASRLTVLGVLPDNAKPEDVLNLTARDFLERRLQTIVVRKNLAKSMRQSRQLITHGHIAIGNKKITVPSYLVKHKEENDVCFAKNSSFADIDHPERVQEKQVEAK